MATLSRTLADAARSLRRHPGLSITAIVTLAVGIASPAAMFSVATGILGELPFDQPHELVEIEVDDLPGARTNIGATLDDLDAWRQARTSFDGIAGVDRRTFQVGGAGVLPDRIRGAAISPEAFALLGVTAIRGRPLGPGDAAPDAPGVVVLGYDVWEDRFASDPDVIGAAVRVDGEARTVVGVMAEGFQFPRTERLWVPLTRGPASDPARVSAFGRLRDGIDPDAAQAELALVAANLAAARPDTHRDLTISVHPFAHAELGDGEAALMLYAMTLVLSFVLVVACVNVAHLLLAHSIARSRDNALRMALGASRTRVLGGTLAESLLLSVAGGAVGVGLAYATVGWLDARLGPVINLFWAKIEVDATVLAFVAILASLAAIMAGLLPARQAASIHLVEALKERRGAARGLRSGRTARALIGVQISFSCGLLILSGLMVRGVIGLASRDLGFEPDGVLTGRVELRAFDYPDRASRLAFVEELGDELRNAPGIIGVAFASRLPGLGAELRTIELEADPGRPVPDVGLLATTPDFFRTFRAERVAGRAFARGEPETARVAVVTDVFARRLVPDGRAVGRRFRYADRADGTMGADPWIEIVGVVEDGGLFSEGGSTRPGILVPFALEAPRSFAIALRTSDAASAAPLLREAVRSRNPDLPLYEVTGLRAALRDASVVQRTFGMLFGVFGLVALLMAIVGLYAVVAYGVERRGHEVAMRRALGATRPGILRLLMRAATLPLVGGLAVGTGLALAIAPALGAALFGTSPRDPSVYVAVVAVLSIAALAAALVPSLAATRIDPIRALRAD